MSVDTLIAHVEKSLPKWRAWFPSEGSHVEITRGELLELIGEIKRLRKIMADFLHHRLALEKETEDYAEGQLLSERGMALRDKMREAVRAMAAEAAKVEAVNPCTSFGADPDLKPGPLTQEDRGWKPEDDER